MSLPQKYEISEREKFWREFWQKQEIYQFDESSSKPVFSVDTPPPYVSADHLHPGHIMSYSQAEFVVRFKRMQGFNVFYPMGFDDNGLPTERFVEKKYNIKNKQAISRSEFIKLCLAETESGSEVYKNLWNLLGISVDWTKTYSTISPHAQKVAQWSFLDLYKKQKLYQAEKPIMWCTHCQTALAQADLEDEEKPTNLVHIRVFTDTGESIVFATTRPELLPSCVGMSIHPDDTRYTDLVGKTFTMPITGVKIALTTDSMIDPTYGTGVVYFCSSGDNQYLDWATRHHIETPIFMLESNGVFNELAGSYHGMTVLETRKQIVEDLQALGVVEQIDPIRHTVKVHERCGTDIEYLISKQWFINVVDYKEELLEQGKKLNWHPKRMFKLYEDWVSSLKWDWCISRQRYYGVPIPVWYHRETGEIILPQEDELPVDPTEYTPRGYRSEDLIPEQDVLDTWMTSSVSPLVAAKLVTNEQVVEKLYPMTIRPQAFEIIRTWLFYTVTKSYYHHNSLPFRDVMISGHGLDKQGRKISKRLGNFTPPEETIAEFGADAMRYWATGTTLGENIRFNQEEIIKGKKTVNKLFNVARFAEMHFKDYTHNNVEFDALELSDQWILDQLRSTIQEVTESFEGYEYFKARTALDDFFWNTLTDNYLEFIKYRLYDVTPEGQESRTKAQYTLYTVLYTLTQLYAPILPFITEEIYQGLFRDTLSSIHITEWPKVQTSWVLSNDQIRDFNEIIRIISEIRAYKSQNGISLGKELEEFTYTSERNLTSQHMFIERATRVGKLIRA